MLNSHHATRAETLAVAAAIHFVQNGNFRIAGQQEIGVQRMTKPAFDGAVGRNKRLSQHLSAENALRTVLRAGSEENVDFDRLEIEQLDQLLDGRSFILRFDIGHRLPIVEAWHISQAGSGRFPSGKAFAWTQTRPR